MAMQGALVTGDTFLEVETMSQSRVAEIQGNASPHGPGLGFDFGVPLSCLAASAKLQSTHADFVRVEHAKF